MANYEDTRPRNDIIVLVTILSVVALLAYAWGVTSYFTELSEDEVRSKVLTRGHEVAAQAEAEAQKALQSGPVTIDEAMRMLAEEGRDADPVIKPSASNQVDPLYGWAFHPDYEERKAELQAAGTAAEVTEAADEEADEAQPAETKKENAGEDTGTQKDVTPEAEQATGE